MDVEEKTFSSKSLPVQACATIVEVKGNKSIQKGESRMKYVAATALNPFVQFFELLMGRRSDIVRFLDVYL